MGRTENTNGNGKPALFTLEYPTIVAVNVVEQKAGLSRYASSFGRLVHVFMAWPPDLQAVVEVAL